MSNLVPFFFTVNTTCPVHFNPLFPPSFSDKAFAAWVDHRIVSIKHLYIDGTFASLEQLTRVVNLPRFHLFRYLQVQDCKHFPGFPMIPLSTLVDIILNIYPYERWAIFVTYKIYAIKFWNVFIHPLVVLAMGFYSVK